MRWLDPGPLAELRRMNPETGAPAFWRLAAKHPGTIGRHDRMTQWMEIIRILAILTPKGDPALRPKMHRAERRLGAVLCDGGDPQWSGPDAVFSERRLAQLLASRGSHRALALQRAARMLASRRVAETGVDIRDIALVILRPDDVRRIAEPYYSRLDRAEQAAKKAANAEEKEGTA
jgi:CRISPR system Cascade subunit CasB